MAGKKENLKALFTNTRTRVIILFTIALVIAIITVGYFKFIRVSGFSESGRVNLSRAPSGIKSIPGQVNQTAQYAALQHQQNVEQAKRAAKKGSSSIPTIIKTQAFGDGVDVIGPQYGEGGSGFVTLSLSELGGAEKSLWTEQLEQNKCSSASIKSILDKGATLTDLREGCNCCQLRQYGYALQDLDPVCSCQQLKAAGFTARELRVAGYTASKLYRCGYSACETKGAGFSATEMKDGGYSDGELKGAGFNDKALADATGLPAGISSNEIKAAGCDPEKLQKLKEKGVSAAAIHRMNGCSAAQLKAAGYGADELRRAGFSAAELKDAGFTPDELRRAGFSARELMNAGFVPDELLNGGYSSDAVRAAESALPPGITPSQLRKAGCSLETIKREKAAGVSAKAIKQAAGCSQEALKQAGFSGEELANAGFSSVPDSVIRKAGCDPQKLKALRAKGVSAKQIKTINGCSPEQLKAAGFSAKELSEAGFTPEELLNAGYIPDELRAAGISSVSDDAIKKAGCEPEQLKQLKAQGVTAQRIREISGCSLAQLKAAGYSARELADAGFTPAELLKAGFDSGQLNSAGLIPASVIAAGRAQGCNVEQLKAARQLGVSASTIRETLGCSASAMRAAGYSAQELKDAGYSAAELKNAGFSADELKAAGFTAQELKDAGFSAQELKDAGYSLKDLADAGFTPEELKQLGFSDEEIKSVQKPESSPQQSKFFSPIQTRQSSSQAKKEPVTAIPSIENRSGSKAETKAKKDTKQLQDLMAKQQSHLADQRYQAKLKQLTGRMMNAAGQMLGGWKTVPTQVLVMTSEAEKSDETDGRGLGREQGGRSKGKNSDMGDMEQPPKGELFIRTGDILFAVLDTAVNTDEPGPILATIVTGKLKGSKLIGSFTLPGNAEKMVITFNTLSMLGADQSIGISAYAIDPSTARTALASRINHHYLMRYGSLFASTFLSGFSSAIQSADTTITVGGTGGTTDTTVQNGINRSLLENALIGLGEVGQAWSQQAQQLVNRPTTVELFSGTGMGVLFTQDVQLPA